MATRFRGVVFDVDGVLVDSPHELAWRDGLQQLMENEWSDIRDQTSYSPEAFTPQPDLAPPALTARSKSPNGV